MRRWALAGFFVLLAVASRAEQTLPEIRAIEISGATAYSRDAILRIIRLKPGAGLQRGAGSVASVLETRYRDEGYPAARVAGAWDPDSGTLTLAVDEGRVASVVVEGTAPGSAARALEGGRLQPGRVLRSEDIVDAFDRLESASDRSLEAGDYRLEPTDEGLRVVLVPRRSAARVEYRWGGTRTTRRYNRVDGFNLNMGADLVLFDHSSFNHLTPYLLGGYGTASERLRYAAGVSRPFGSGQRVTLGYEYHDVTDTDDSYRSVGLEEAPGTPITFTSYGDYFRRQGHEAYAFVRFNPRAQLGVAFRSDDYTSLPVAVDDPQAEPNPVIDAGSSRSFIATLRLDTGGPLFESRGQERHSFLQRSLYGLYHQAPHGFRGEVTYEVAARSLGGDFDFRRLVANLRARAPLPARQRLDARLLLGVTGGEPPLQKQFALGGIGTLRGYELKAFPGKNMATTSVEWSVAPRTLLPRFIVFYDGGVAWTRDLDGPGWKNDLGLALRFPADAGLFLRLDFAWAVGDAHEKSAHTLFRIQIPI